MMPLTGAPGDESRQIPLAPGRVLHARLAGPAGGPEIVFFPGNRGSTDDMSEVWPALTAAGYRFVGIDAPGREPVEWPDEAFDFHRDLPAAADAAMEALAIGPHLVVGHSMGGMYALHHARRHPGLVRGIVLVEGFTTLPIHYRLAAPNGYDAARMPPAIHAAWQTRHAANDAWIKARPQFDASFWPSQQSHDARPFVADLDLPILVVLGDKGQPLPDTLDGWREALGMVGVEDLTVLRLQGAGHWSMLDASAELTAGILAFAARLRDGNSWR